MRRRLRVLTWNVGRVYSPSHNNRLDDADIPRVARVLAELDPDVALLQELIDERQLRALRVLLHRAGEFHGAIAQKCIQDRRAALLVRAERAPAFEEHPLGVTHPNHCHRDAIDGEGTHRRTHRHHHDCRDQVIVQTHHLIQAGRGYFCSSSSGRSMNLLIAHTSRARRPSKRTPMPRSRPSSISSQRTCPSASTASGCVGTLKRSLMRAPNGSG
jgi:hypothetical protein